MRKKAKEVTNAEIKGSTVILAFDRYEEAEELKTALKASDYYIALWDTAQEVFRPHRKHGYPDEELNKLIENDDVLRAIELLEQKFYGILKDRDIDL